MSLFQARSWWAAPTCEQDAFDVGCMCVGNIDNDHSNDSKIVTGSHTGMLRIYSPKSKEYKVEDLVLEKDLGYPIIHLLSGRFITQSQEVGRMKHLTICLD